MPAQHVPHHIMASLHRSDSVRSRVGLSPADLLCRQRSPSSKSSCLCRRVWTQQTPSPWQQQSPRTPSLSMRTLPGAYWSLFQRTGARRSPEQWARMCSQHMRRTTHRWPSAHACTVSPHRQHTACTQFGEHTQRVTESPSIAACIAVLRQRKPDVYPASMRQLCSACRCLWGSQSLSPRPCWRQTGPTQTTREM